MGLAFQEVENEIKVSDFNISLSANIPNKNSYNKFIETVNLDGIEDYTLLRSSELFFIGTHYSKDYLDFLNIKQREQDEEYITVFAIGEEQYKKYIKSLGLNYDDIKDKAILLDKDYQVYYGENNKRVTKYIRKFNFNKGDIIDSTITSTNKNVKIEIAEITEIKPFGLKNMSANYIVLSDEMFDNIAYSNGLDIYYKSSNANKLQDDIEDYLKGEEYYSINNKDENVKQMSNLFTLVGIFLYGWN